MTFKREEYTTTGLPLLDAMFHEGMGPRKGTRTAISGPSGSGKTELSLITLLSDYFVPKLWVESLRKETKKTKTGEIGIIDSEDGNFLIRDWKAKKKAFPGSAKMLDRIADACDRQEGTHVSLLFAFKDDEGSVMTMLEDGYVGCHFMRAEWAKPDEDIKIFKEDKIEWDDLLCKRQGLKSRSERFLEIVPLPTGYVSPGFLLKRIRQEFKRNARKHREIRRVAFDNIAHMELCCPQVAEDKVFVTGLKSLLDIERVSTIFVLSSLSELKAPQIGNIQAQIADICPNVIACTRFVHRGRDCVAIHIEKSLTLMHGRHLMELDRDPKRGLLLKPSLDLIRDVTKREPEEIPIRFILQTESPAQERYNRHIIQTVKAVLCRDVSRIEVTHLYLHKGLSKSHLSALQELQIVQVDEYQLPKVRPRLKPIPWDRLSPSREEDDYLL